MMVERDMRPPVDAWLRAQGMTDTLWESFLFQNADLVGVRFVRRVGPAIPPIERCIVVELKMCDVAGVLRQCHRQRHYPAEAYAAMPRERVARMRPATVERFRTIGAGLLSVNGDGVQVVIEPVVSDKEWGAYRPKALWRRVNELRRATRVKKLQGTT